MMEVIGSNWKLKRKTKNLQLKIKKKLNDLLNLMNSKFTTTKAKLEQIIIKFRGI